MFCPKCGSILQLKKSGGKKINLICQCGYVEKEQKDFLIRERGVLEIKDKIEVMDKKIETLPKTEEECPKCDNREAYYWLVQTRAGDEAETMFFRCTKCGHTWRSYT